MNQLDMQGRHAVITGGATGLGYAIAQRMLASGASVTLWDRDTSAPSGFYISCFPHKIRGASAGWTRAVAIFDDALMASDRS